MDFLVSLQPLNAGMPTNRAVSASNIFSAPLLSPLLASQITLFLGGWAAFWQTVAKDIFGVIRLVRAVFG
jgi:hypothetical protein